MSRHSSRNRAVLCAASSTPAPAGSEPSPQQRLIEAALQGDVAEVAALLSRREVDINAAAEGMNDTPAGKAAWWCENHAVARVLMCMPEQTLHPLAFLAPLPSTLPAGLRTLRHSCCLTACNLRSMGNWSA